MNNITDTFQKYHQEMIEDQLRLKGINDENVLNAFSKIQRDLFVLSMFKESAYTDNALPIKCGQTISQPYIAALMTQALELKSADKVLEIGTGSGYQAAIISLLAKKVYTIERIAELATFASKNLKKSGITNIEISIGDGTLGLPQHAPFDKIIVTASSPIIPSPLLEQLKMDGKMVIPIGDENTQELITINKTAKGIQQIRLCSCVFVPLIGKFGWQL